MSWGNFSPSANPFPSHRRATNFPGNGDVDPLVLTDQDRLSLPVREHDEVVMNPPRHFLVHVPFSLQDERLHRLVHQVGDEDLFELSPSMSMA